MNVTGSDEKPFGGWRGNYETVSGLYMFSFTIQGNIIIE